MLAHDILDGTWYSSAKNNAINGVLLEVTVERASVSQGSRSFLGRGTPPLTYTAAACDPQAHCVTDERVLDDTRLTFLEI